MEELYFFNILQLPCTVRLMVFQTYVYFSHGQLFTHAINIYLALSIYLAYGMLLVSTHLFD